MAQLLQLAVTESSKSHWSREINQRLGRLCKSLVCGQEQWIWAKMWEEWGVRGKVGREGGQGFGEMCFSLRSASPLPALNHYVHALAMNIASSLSQNLMLIFLGDEEDELCGAGGPSPKASFAKLSRGLHIDCLPFHPQAGISTSFLASQGLQGSWVREHTIGRGSLSVINKDYWPTWGSCFLLTAPSSLLSEPLIPSISLGVLLGRKAVAGGRRGRQ